MITMSKIEKGLDIILAYDLEKIIFEIKVSNLPGPEQYFRSYVFILEDFTNNWVQLACSNREKTLMITKKEQFNDRIRYLLNRHCKFEEAYIDENTLIVKFINIHMCQEYV